MGTEFIYRIGDKVIHHFAQYEGAEAASFCGLRFSQWRIDTRRKGQRICKHCTRILKSDTKWERWEKNNALTREQQVQRWLGLSPKSEFHR